MIFAGGPHKVPPAKIIFFQADLLSSPPGKIDFHRRTVSFTPIYIFLGDHLAPTVIPAWKNKRPTLLKIIFLVVFVPVVDRGGYVQCKSTIKV
jgi:hypothetical protein